MSILQQARKERGEGRRIIMAPVIIGWLCEDVLDVVRDILQTEEMESITARAKKVMEVYLKYKD